MRRDRIRGLREGSMIDLSTRRVFVKRASFLVAGAGIAWAADTESVVAETSYGKVRGSVSGDIKVFKGIPYGADTSGSNRFMPPAKPAKWTDVRDALAYGPTAPQTAAGGRGRAGASRTSVHFAGFAGGMKRFEPEVSAPYGIPLKTF